MKSKDTMTETELRQLRDEIHKRNNKIEEKAAHSLNNYYFLGFV